jgi:hypothetical protein
MEVIPRKRFSLPGSLGREKEPRGRVKVYKALSPK